ncbi:N/A [soil metagenome]
MDNSASTILVIEQDLALRELLVEWLESAGYAVRTSLSGRSVAAIAVDVILVDLPDPRATGAATVARWRAEHRGAHVIALSTRLERSIGATSRLNREFGADRLLAKPLGRTELLAVVQSVLGRAART